MMPNKASPEMRLQSLSKNLFTKRIPMHQKKAAPSILTGAACG
jgi:hypothetical protein